MNNVLLINGTLAMRRIEDTYPNNPHYVGTIEIDGIPIGNGCLLESGEILTCLHNVIDYTKVKKSGAVELINFTAHNVFIYFEKNNYIFKYRIDGAFLTGINELRNSSLQSWSFDYAFLGTDGDPVQDIGGGFKLDNQNPYGLLTERPTETLAISGPSIKRQNDGTFAIHRDITRSKSQSATSKHMTLVEMGSHPTEPGSSGKAIIPCRSRRFHANTLYALHSYRDNQSQQCAVKTSEILQSVNFPSLSSTSKTISQNCWQILQSWFEKYTLARIKIDGSIVRGKEVTFDEALDILETTTYKKGNWVEIKADTQKESKDLKEAWNDSTGHSKKTGKPRYVSPKMSQRRSSLPSCGQV